MRPVIESARHAARIVHTKQYCRGGLPPAVGVGIAEDSAGVRQSLKIPF